jgi:hypothetical protein
LNVRFETINYRRKYKGNILDTGLANAFLNMTPKAQAIKATKLSRTLANYRASASQRKTQQNLKGHLGNRRKYLYTNKWKIFKIKNFLSYL